uniref:Fanconi Anaemia group E protein C-terminal domain-containing protein n=1 Tax=Lygus hesperus TaxID=30085 RepID=A0A0K8TDG5_LYGHE
MASWGKAKLSPAALLYLEEANNGLEEEALDGIQKKLLLATQRAEVQGYSSGAYGLLNDLPETSGNATVVHSQRGMEAMEIAPPVVDTQIVATQIVEHILTGSENINVVIDLVSNLSDQALDDVVLKSWSLLKEDHHKKSFIISMSATRNSAMSVSKSILLPLFSSKVDSKNALSSFGPALEWLEYSISKTLVLPMLLNENSPITQDMTYCKAFFAALTEAQRADALVSLSTSIQGELLPWHLQSLSVVLELPIDSSAASSICKLLTPSVPKFSQDRLMGKILLSLITILTPSAPPQVIHDVSSLASYFKGPLRFRHKQALDKLSAQIHTG